jgi:hypothetical protein
VNGESEGGAAVKSPAIVGGECDLSFIVKVSLGPRKPHAICTYGVAVTVTTVVYVARAALLSASARQAPDPYAFWQLQ